MRTLGFHSYTHDSAAAVADGGRLLAFTEEERLSRRKGDPSFPAKAIAACLKESGIAPAEIERVIVPFRPRAGAWRRLAYLARRPGSFLPRAADLVRKGRGILGLRERLREVGIGAPVEWRDHYVCHAAAVFCASPFERAAVLVVDGVAEGWTGALFEGIRFPGPRLREVGRLDFPHSLGLVYAAVTEHLGFRHNREEGKVMSMAALGEDRFDEAFGRICRAVELRLAVNQRFFDFAGRWTTPVFEREFCPPRRPGEPFLREHFALARALQRATEAACLKLARGFMAATGCADLCFTGGLALNPTLNGVVAGQSGCRSFFALPAGGDAGTALGAALLPAADPMWRLEHAFWGRGWSSEQIGEALESRGLRAVADGEGAVRKAAHLLAGGAIGARFAGRSEMGPRALGHRSILADPRTQGMKDRLNGDIKRREPFQPFAPVALPEACVEFFPGGQDSPFMLRTVPVPEGVRGRIPAVVHSDGTARVQSVADGDVSGLSGLLRAFQKETGLAVLLNTSLNRKGEPIADSPEDALSLFAGSDLDFLLMEDLLVVKGGGR